MEPPRSESTSCDAIQRVKTHLSSGRKRNRHASILTEGSRDSQPECRHSWSNCPLQSSLRIQNSFEHRVVILRGSDWAWCRTISCWFTARAGWSSRTRLCPSKQSPSLR
jgi:hypothetical protein